MKPANARPVLATVDDSPDETVLSTERIRFTP